MEAQRNNASDTSANHDFEGNSPETLLEPSVNEKCNIATSNGSFLKWGILTFFTVYLLYLLQTQVLYRV